MRSNGALRFCADCYDLQSTERNPDVLCDLHEDVYSSQGWEGLGYRRSTYSDLRYIDQSYIQDANQQAPYDSVYRAALTVFGVNRIGDLPHYRDVWEPAPEELDQWWDMLPRGANTWQVRSFLATCMVWGVSPEVYQRWKTVCSYPLGVAVLELSGLTKSQVRAAKEAGSNIPAWCYVAWRQIALKRWSNQVSVIDAETFARWYDHDSAWRSPMRTQIWMRHFGVSDEAMREATRWEDAVHCIGEDRFHLYSEMSTSVSTRVSFTTLLNIADQWRADGRFTSQDAWYAIRAAFMLNIKVTPSTLLPDTILGQREAISENLTMEQLYEWAGWIQKSQSPWSSERCTDIGAWRRFRLSLWIGADFSSAEDADEWYLAGCRSPRAAAILRNEMGDARVATEWMVATISSDARRLKGNGVLGGLRETDDVQLNRASWIASMHSAGFPLELALEFADSQGFVIGRVPATSPDSE